MIVFPLYTIFQFHNCSVRLLTLETKKNENKLNKIDKYIKQ